MLLSACEQGNLEIIQEILPASNLEEKNSQGFTPLSIASKLGYLDIVNLLISSGAKINTQNSVIFIQ